MDNATATLLHSGLINGRIVPYTGPGLLSLAQADAHTDKLANSPVIPHSPETLVGRLTAKASVPHKIRNNLTAAAQFIENFKHRKSVVASMNEAFSAATPVSELHRFIAALPSLPLWVHAWYDSAPTQVMQARGGNWGMVQGASQAEHFGEWVQYFNADGTRNEMLNTVSTELPWPSLLYQPIGSVTPAANYLVSDSDYVEVLTEIDIQTPIPKAVQAIRTGRSFLFMGCRFSTQLERSFAQQIIKRSSDRHWAIFPDQPTRNEQRFMELYHIERIEMPLADWLRTLQTVEADANDNARRASA